jgi:hypothetical protein
VGEREGLADLDDLPRALFGPEVDRRSDSRRTEIERFFDGPEKDLIELVRISEQLG